MKAHFISVLASLLATAACASSDSGSGSHDGTSSGGHDGSDNGSHDGSGGASRGGSGGSSGAGGSPLPFGSGGTISVTDGARADRGDDTAADGGEQDTGDGKLHFDVDIAYVLRQNCGGCHLSPTVSGNFDMKIVDDLAPGPGAYPSVTGAVSPAHSGCTKLDATKRRVVPGKPDNSLLYIKISADTPPSGCGTHMPNGGVNIPPNYLATIKLWIMQGALK